MNEFTVNDPPVPDDGPPRHPVWMPILIGAIVIATLSVIPFVGLTCCLHMILGGLVATWLYSWSFAGAMPMSKGIMIGLISTLLGGILSVMVIDAIWLLFDYQIGAETMKNAAMKLAEMLGDEVYQQMREQLEEATETELTPMVFVAQLASTLFMSAIAGLISGSLGAAIFKGGRG
jgi:mannitol-specific phosphotransferase system IIBC component